jgi:acetylornithine/succinyldiaminopimelate/putrescine aminotransferase
MLEVVKAEGIYLYGPDGKKYFDLISGISVSNLGHGHPDIVKAVQEQAETYMHLMVFGEYIQSPQVKLAKAIAGTLPDHLHSVYFVNSGSEAVEGALKIAKKYTGRSKIISAYKAYHGSSHGALSVGGEESLKKGYGPLLPDIHHIDFGNNDQLSSIDLNTACVILESVQGEAGVRIASSDYWKNLRSKCDQTGTLLIVDEIQTGFGRTGTFWAFEQFGYEPDILLTAKGMGAGMPIGAFISTPEIMNVIMDNPVLGHITTFGGHPVSASASLAGIKLLLESEIINKVWKKAELFSKYLKDITKVKEIRYMGLLMAVEFESFEVLKPIIDKGISLGVITDWFLFDDHSMRIAPPLTISEEEIEEACKLIKKAIQSV